MTSDALVIMPGDRVDNMLTAAAVHMFRDPGLTPVAAILLTCGIRPPETIMRLLRKTGLCVLATEDDTCTVAARLRSTVFKIEPQDQNKIRDVERLVREYVDVDFALDQSKADA